MKYLQQTDSPPDQNSETNKFFDSKIFSFLQTNFFNSDQKELPDFYRRNSLDEIETEFRELGIEDYFMLNKKLKNFAQEFPSNDSSSSYDLEIFMNLIEEEENLKKILSEIKEDYNLEEEEYFNINKYIEITEQIFISKVENFLSRNFFPPEKEITLLNKEELDLIGYKKSKDLISSLNIASNVETNRIPIGLKILWERCNLTLKFLLRKNSFIQNSTNVENIAEELPNKEERFVWRPDRSSFVKLYHNFLVVPGGRFREPYYWDGFFQLMGMLDLGYIRMALLTVENYLDMVDKFGSIPNGGRVYYLTRSQPPFLCLMVEEIFLKLENLNESEISKIFDYENYITEENENKSILSKSLIKKRLLENGLNFTKENFLKIFLRSSIYSLEKELSFWNNERKIKVNYKGKIAYLHRYNNEISKPRPEGFTHDFEVEKRLKKEFDYTTSKAKIESFYKNTRTGCESGLDFSSKLFKKNFSLFIEMDKVYGNDEEEEREKGSEIEFDWNKMLGEIKSSEIIPAELNALVWQIYKVLESFTSKLDAYTSSEVYSSEEEDINPSIFENLREDKLDCEPLSQNVRELEREKKMIILSREISDNEKIYTLKNRNNCYKMQTKRRAKLLLSLFFDTEKNLFSDLEILEGNSNFESDEENIVEVERTSENSSKGFYSISQLLMLLVNFNESDNLGENESDFDSFPNLRRNPFDISKVLSSMESYFKLENTFGLLRVSNLDTKLNWDYNIWPPIVYLHLKVIENYEREKIRKQNLTVRNDREEIRGEFNEESENEGKGELLFGSETIGNSFLFNIINFTRKSFEKTKQDLKIPLSNTLSYSQSPQQNFHENIESNPSISQPHESLGFMEKISGYFELSDSNKFIQRNHHNYLENGEFCRGGENFDFLEVLNGINEEGREVEIEREKEGEYRVVYGFGWTISLILKIVRNLTQLHLQRID